MDETAPAQGVATDRRSLMVIDGRHNQVQPLPERGTVDIGRSSDNAIVLTHPSVSRLHATLRLDNEITVVDRGSANGTWVGGARLAPNTPVRLVVGQPVRLGDVFVAVQYGGLHRPPATGAMPAEGVVLNDPAMLELYRQVDRVAASDLSVLITGETGVGKELVAEAIHRRSARAGGLFVKVNCGALSASLIESELFGHVKGAFTGADRAKTGLIASAHRGTFFLDEVGELPPELQVRLLRVLEDHRVRPVGAVEDRPVDVRFVAATHRDLKQASRDGTFREDLYFRLNTVSLTVPSLRERPADILPLVDHFARQIAVRLGRPPPVLTRPVLEALKNHSWPGNVRELRNVVERIVVLAGDRPIGPADLPTELRSKSDRPGLAPLERTPVLPETGPPSTPSGQTLPPSADLWDQVRELERRRIIDALEECAGNQTRAAQLLGISRRTLINRLEEYGIPRPIKGRRR